MKQPKGYPIYRHADIRLAIRDTARMVDSSLDKEEEVVAMVIMKGGMFYATELLQHIIHPCIVDYMHLSRYGNLTAGQDLFETVRFPTSRITGRTVLLIDDIFDKGVTLQAAINHCNVAGAKRIVSTVLCAKSGVDRNPTYTAPNWPALLVPNKFVYGFGMDYEGYFRNLTSIWAVDE